jgi:hypothetical protein
LKSNCRSAPAVAVKAAVVNVDPFVALDGVASGLGREPPPGGPPVVDT